MISVCMATYNGAKYVKEQIDSILPQLGNNDELVISDDGSRDETCSIISSYDDPRIKLLYNKGKHGFVGNFENALSHALGDIIVLSDQDDVWKPKKLFVLLGYLKQYDLIVHDAELIDAEGHSLHKNYYSCIHSKNGFWANFLKPRFLGCCMAFRKTVLQSSLPFVSERRGHDYWIGCIALLKFRVAFVPDVLIQYRRHGGNVTPSSEKSANSLFAKSLKRLDMLFSLLLRLMHVK